MIENYFKEQIEGGATKQFFYGTEMNGEVRIERHRGGYQEVFNNFDSPDYVAPAYKYVPSDFDDDIPF